MEQSELRARALASYENARLRRGLVWSLPLTVLAVISLAEAHEHALTLAVTAVAAVSMTLLVKRGEAFGNGARLGLGAGLVPFIVSMLARDTRHFVTSFGHVHGCVIACAAACAVMTVVLSRAAAGPKQWLSATWTMLTVAAIACSCVGVTGVMLLVAMVVAAMAPIRLFVRTAEARPL